MKKVVKKNTGLKRNRFLHKAVTNMKFSELRVYYKLMKAFDVSNCEKSRFSCYEYDYLFGLRDNLNILNDDDYIYYLPRVLMELIQNSDKCNIDFVLNCLNARPGDYYESYHADRRYKLSNDELSYWYSRQSELEKLYNDFTIVQCAAIRDWIILASEYEELKQTQSDDLIVYIFLYWDERSKKYN